LTVRSLVAAFLLLFTSELLASDRLNWPERRGPAGIGAISAPDAEGLPTAWDESTGAGIAWKMPLQGLGHSVPVIGHNRIWLTAATEDGRQQSLYAIDQQSGQVLQHQLVFENESPEPLGNPVNTYASPSCVLEADAVYVHFGTYGTARVNPDTREVVWQRRDISCRHFRGPGSSPIIHEHLLILTFDGIDRQFLTALDKRTGETVWTTDRTTDYGDLDENGKPHRDGDMRKAFSTPGIAIVNGQAQVISVGSRAAFAYDALTGEELWTIRHDDYNAASPPMLFRDCVILNTGSRNSNLLSIRLNETTRGDISGTHVAWDRPAGNSDLSAPLLIRDRVFAVANNGVVTCVSALTGEEIWKDRLKGTFTASPITDGSVICFCNEEGECFLTGTGDSFQLVAENRLAEGMRSSPAAADGHYFLRTSTSLYCLGAQ
jgi:outer membrane protein assembly factor BamB